MTSRERKQVVELLRCAADRGSVVDAGYALGHCDGVKPASRVFLLADIAYTKVHGSECSKQWHSWPDDCLEAAQRVDEGALP